MQSTDIIQPLPLISPIATDGLKNSIPDAATGTNNASIEEGFPQITMQAPADGGLPPFGQDFNGLFYTVSSLNYFLQNGGYITFNQSVSDKIGGYPSGAILDYIDSAGSYSKVQSLIDNNTNNFVTTPSFIDGVNWKRLEVSASALNSFLNQNQITDCILSAPNGVPSYSGNTVTVYGSTQFLFSNGRNSNNTLQNTTFTAVSNITGTMSGSTAGTFIVFATSESSLIFANNINYFITSTEPTALNDTTSQGVWYNPVLNTFSQCAATSSTPSWSTFEGARCATLTYDGSAITAFNPTYPLFINDPSKFDGQWVAKLQTLAQITSGSVEVDLSEYLPVDEYNYEVLLTFTAWNFSSTSQSNMEITSSIMPYFGNYSYTSQGARISGQYIIAVGTNRKIKFTVSGSPFNSNEDYAIAYRRLGTNE